MSHQLDAQGPRLHFLSFMHIMNLSETALQTVQSSMRSFSVPNNHTLPHVLYYKDLLLLTLSGIR
jgi:hypothetical protein